MNTINARQYVNCNIDSPILHPFSYVKGGQFDKIHFQHGDGIYLFDDYGDRYIDVTSGLWNVALGYNNEVIKKAMKEQIDQLSFCSLFEYTNEVAIECANKLLELTNQKMSKVIYTCSGSETNEVAVKVMRKYCKMRGYQDKNCILSFSESYHGTTYGAMSVSGIEQELIRDYHPIVTNIHFIDPILCKHNCVNDCKLTIELKELADWLSNESKHIAGIIIEPILASKGMMAPCKSYLKKLIRICRENQILVAFDEVATGFYRTGTCFYYESLQLYPDILCLSKGINSGYLPIGAVLVNHDICNAFDTVGEIFEHGSTQSGNLVACASVLAALNEYQKLVSEVNLVEKSIIFYNYLVARLCRFHCVENIRNIGFLYSIDICNKSMVHDKFHIQSIVMELRRQRILVYQSDVGISILPMLITSHEQWECIVCTIENVFEHMDF